MKRSVLIQFDVDRKKFQVKKFEIFMYNILLSLIYRDHWKWKRTMMEEIEYSKTRKCF